MAALKWESVSMYLNADQRISWTSMRNEYLNGSWNTHNDAFTFLLLWKGQLGSWHLCVDKIHFFFCILEQKDYEKWFKPSSQHLTLRLESESNGILSSWCFLHELKNLKMHSINEVVYLNTTLDIFDQLDNTFSWVDEPSLIDKCVIHGAENTLELAMGFYKWHKSH